MLSRLRSSEFLRHNAIYFVAAIAVGALNYLYYPVLGRLMEPAEFGEIQTLVSLFLQAIAYLTVMGLVTVHIVANRSSSDANRIVSELEKLATLIGLLLLFLTIVFSGRLERYFQFDSAAPFTLLGVAIIISVPYMLRSGYVNGKKLFGLNAWSSIVSAGGKLVLSAALVAFGFGVGGAVFGIILAQIVALGLAAYFAKRHGFRDLARRQIGLPDMRLLRPELGYAGLVLVGSLSVTILYSVDIIVIKHYFDPHTAGLYASVATVARILFFLTIPIAQVLMPSVRLNAKAEENTRTLIKSAGLLSLIGGGTLAVFWLWPEFVVGTLMGSEYRQYAQLLPRLGLAIFIISALNLITTYYMALRNAMAGALVASGALITYLLMNANHASLESVVNSLLFGTLLTTLFFAFWIGLKSHMSFTNRFTNRTVRKQHSVARNT
jgi:O-antigen/teichoic acid export membrane protein